MNNKICICFFGVIPRSIKYTIETHNNLIDKLKKIYNVEVYTFNLNVEDTMVDNVKLDQNDVKLIKSDYHEEKKQSILDEELDILFKKGICKMRKDYSQKSIQNSLRQMYSEYRVGCFLEKNIDKYNGAVVCGPDYYLLNELEPKDYFRLDDTVYTTRVNDAQGYTNGFYLGKLQPLIKILKRYEEIESYLPTNKDYENVLLESFIKHNVKRQKINLLFLKIRANKHIARQGIMGNKKYDDIIEKVKIDIDKI